MNLVNRTVLCLLTVSYAGAHVSIAPPSSSLFSASDIPFSSHPLPSPTVHNVSQSNRSSNNISTCSIDDDDFNLINIDIAENIFRASSSDYELEDIVKPLTSNEIAVLLVELRYRHSLTQSCVTQFCQFLQLLRVPNAPLSFANVESLVLSSYRSTKFATKVVICPSCYKRSSSSKMCTSTPNCDSKVSFVRAPTTNYTFAIEPQIRSIIERNPIKKSVRASLTASYMKKILEMESQTFLTLLMNSDGGLVKAISTSIWLATFVINALPRELRYLPENLVFGLLWTGSMKRKKDEMAEIMFDMANELRRLEEGMAVFSQHANDDKMQKKL